MTFSTSTRELDSAARHSRWTRGTGFLPLLLAIWVVGPGARPISANPVDYLATTWRTEEGLPHSAVNSIVQTRDGYLWIGTFVGVVRFDGVRFVHFSPAEIPELGAGRVSKLFEDRDGVLWIGLETGRLVAWQHGAPRIHPSSSSAAPDMTNSTPAPELRRDGQLGRPAPSDAIIAMAQDRTGTIWLQTANGRLGRLTPGGVEFIADTGQSALRASLGLVVSHDGTLWVGTRDGLRIFEDGKLVEPPGLAALGNQPVDAFNRARDGGIWFFRDLKLRKFREGKVETEIAAPPQFEGNAGDLIEAADGKLWLVVASGALWCYDAARGWNDVSGAAGLRGGSKVLLEDREGNVWRGSFGGGLTRLRPKFFATSELPPGDFDRYAGSVTAEANGGVWMMLNGHTLAHRAPQPASAPDLELLRPPVIPSGLRSIYADRSGTLWLGCADGRLGRWRHDAEFIAEVTAGQGGDYINVFFEDAQSNVWVGYSQGAGLGFMPGGDPKSWREIAGLAYPDVRAIAQSPDGAMWFGTHYGGVFRFQNGNWARFTTRDGLASDYIRCLKADADGTVWLGTMYGLSRWRKGKLVTIKTEHGLWHNAISAILDDAQGNFWMSSFGGIFRVARQELNDFADGRRTSVSCVGYNRGDGVPALESPGGFQPAGAKATDGRLWFPTVDGVVSFNPEQIVPNRRVPPVVIETVMVDGKLWPWRDGKIEIPPGKQMLEIRFTALSLTAPEKIRFRHRLEGLETDWSPPEDRRAVAYKFVPPGDYTLRVMACNNDGVWNEAGVTISVVVQPWIWQTWWFRIGAGSGLIGALTWLVRRREQQKARARLEQLERAHAVERERARIAQDIHDDVGASLTQIAFLSERVKSAGADVAEVGRWNQRVAKAARDTIQSLDEIVWAVSPEHDTLESLANYLARFAQDHLSLAGIRCLLEVATVLPPVAVSAEMRHNLLLAAREALQNAVTHAAATEVRVGLVLRADTLEIRIADNGRGFDVAGERREGNGLSNLRKRLAEIGGQVAISSQPGQGTTILLSVPRSRLEPTGEQRTDGVE